MSDRTSLACCLAIAALFSPALAPAETPLDFTVDLEVPVDAPKDAYWMQVRAGIVPPGQPGAPADKPLVVVAMQLHDRVGVHTYHGLSSMWSDDLGKTWHGPTKHECLDWRIHDAGLIEVPVDTTPQWHTATGKLLLTGATFWIDPKIRKHAPDGPSDTPYAIYDPVTHRWSNWKKLIMPEDDPRFLYARAGCTQRVDLPNGDILLPIYFGHGGNDARKMTTVVRCRFDGEALRYIEHGDELKLDVTRGLGEPSLIKYGGTFYLTIRNDIQGYVATSKDGLHFSEIKPWTFDDGENLDSYNTQQHWVAHSNGLYLAYTRRSAYNDEIFRHRAPVFMARVDPEKVHVIRDTEREILPKLQAGFGNFGVADVTPNETWIVAGRRGAKEGEPSVYIARIHWNKSNKRVKWAEE